MDMAFSIFSTFTGAGGLDLGFHGGFKFLGKEYKRLSFNTKVSLDINKDAKNTIEANQLYFKSTKALCEDIITHNHEKYQSGDYDVLLGGFPCVTFSIVGKQTGVKDDINGRLYESFAKYLEFLKPKVFLAENVKGILSANKGEAIKIIRDRFSIDGYNLKIFLVNFADFGFP